MSKLVSTREYYGKLINHFEDDDFIDRLNNRWTVRALIICIVFTSGYIFWGKPISCWTPTQFNVPHHEYTSNICWLKGSYYLPTEEITIPDRSKPQTYFVSYYQWTPFILVGMTLFFLFPRFLWHAFSRRSGVNIAQLVQTIKADKNREKALHFVKGTLKEYLDTQNELGGMICCDCRCHNFYFGYTLAYFGVKLFYITNTICQFVLLNSFLSFHFTSYGVEALKKMFNSEDWFESARFPRVTMCDFVIRDLGSNQQWYAVQCYLPFNMYNEKIFLGIWIWLIILSIFNILSIIWWMISLTRACQLASIRKYLKIGIPVSREEKRLLPLITTTSTRRQVDPNRSLDDFMDYLHMDGYLIFRLIGCNTDEIVSGTLIEYLYNNYEPSHRYRLSNV